MPSVATEKRTLPGAMPCTSLRNGTNQSINPCRTNPVQNSATVRVMMTGLVNTRVTRWCQSIRRSRSASWAVASSVSKSAKPAAEGVFCTRKTSITPMTAMAAAGIRNTQYHGSAARIQPPTVSARR